jgi:hypothetical protein
VDQTQFMTFFVKDRLGKLVAAKYLRYNGQLVSDPNIQIAQQTRLYDASGNLLQHQDVEGFLIVPADFSIEKAIAFAKSVQELYNTPDVGEFGNLVGPEMADGAMISGFATYTLPGGKAVIGSQDLQRVYDGTIGESVPAFTSAASFYVGLVASYVGYSLEDVERGGGWLNRINKLRHAFIDTSGPYGNNPHNTAEISKGFDFARSLPGSQSHSENTLPLITTASPSMFADDTSYLVSTYAGGDKNVGAVMVVPVDAVNNVQESSTVNTLVIDGDPTIVNVTLGKPASGSSNDLVLTQPADTADFTITTGNGDNQIIYNVPLTNNPTTQNFVKIFTGNGNDTIGGAGPAEIDLGNGNDFVLPGFRGWPGGRSA